MKLHAPIAVALAAALFASTASAQTTATLDLDLAHRGPAIPPTFAGFMTEEINHSYDGGLYAELVQNRTFQDNASNPDHWWPVGTGRWKLDHDDPVNPALPVSLRVDLDGSRSGIANEGYWGIPVRPDSTYTATFYAKGGGGFSAPVRASIVLNEGGTVVATADSAAVTGAWVKYTLKLTTGHDVAETSHARFNLTAEGTGSVSFSFASLFPPTYMDAPGGLRPDLMKLMDAMHPSFIRLPGGNYLEGDTFATRYDWKKQIGPADQRPGHMGCWSYRSSDGFGLPQCLLWCKQLHAQPVLAVFAGYTLNHDHVVAGPELKPYVDEALEEIEYVTGPATSTWGKRRAADGFPEPFDVTYLEVGNEDWFDGSGSYDGRFTQFFDAIRARYPKLKIIATAAVHSRKPDLQDDHFYLSPRQMSADWTHYDPAAGHDVRAARHAKIFCGEWAAQEGRPTPDLNAALADAAWVMGLERNADLVSMECYAPLLTNVNPGAWQWPTNLIGYDALHSFGSPSYYAQAMLGQNKGDTVVPAKLTVGPPPSVVVKPHGAVGLGAWHTQVQYKELTVVGPDGKSLMIADPMASTDGWTFTGDKWNLQDKSILPGVADGETWGTVGDPKWTDYTVNVKARKTGGNEGFLVLYHAVDGENYRWWNVGGWGDTRTQVEATTADGRAQLGQPSEFRVETDHWYDLRVEVRGNHVRCFADGRLVSEATERTGPATSTVYASATSADAGRTLIVKVVNMSAEPVDAAVTLSGAGRVDPAARAIVLAGNPGDQNTIDEPIKIAPEVQAITDASAAFHRTFPAHSLTVLRLTVAAGK